MKTESRGITVTLDFDDIIQLATDAINDDLSILRHLTNGCAFGDDFYIDDMEVNRNGANLNFKLFLEQD